MQIFDTVLVNTFFTKDQLIDINTSIDNYTNDLQDNPFADNNTRDYLMKDYDFKQILISNGFDAQQGDIDFLVDALIYDNL
jgi:hypothetical protein